MKSKLNINYRAYAVANIVMSALAYIFTKIGLQFFSPFSLSLYRYLAAAIGMIIYLWIKKFPLPQLRDVPLFFVCGATGFAICAVTFNLGAQTVSVSTSSIIIAMTPVFTAILGNIIYKEKLSKGQWSAIVLEFLGVVIICMWTGIISFNLGVLWILLSAISFAVYNILQRRMVLKYSPLETTAYSIIAAEILLLVIFPESLVAVKNLTITAVVSVISLGIFCSCFAYFWWTKALSKATTTSDVTNYLFVSPFLTSLLGFIVFMEIPNLGTWIGGIFIFMGIVLFDCKRLV